jgi:hypothetical protein
MGEKSYHDGIFPLGMRHFNQFVDECLVTQVNAIKGTNGNPGIFQMD